MKTLSAAVLAASLLASPAYAIIPADFGARPATETPLHGTIEKGSSATLLRIDGKAYTLSSLTAVFTRGGAPASATQLVAGKSIMFTVVPGAAQPVLKEVWIAP